MMVHKSLLLRLPAVGVVLLGFLFGTSHAQETIFRSYVDTTFQGGSQREVGQGMLFVPLMQDCDTLIFADLRGAIFDDTSAEGNWGIGYRRLMANDWIVGMYGFYDLRQTGANNNFQQATVGAELLNLGMGFRINGYIPEGGTERVSGLSTAYLSGGSIVVRDGREAAYYGVDAEAEALVHSFCGKLDGEIWAALGGYHFDHNDAGFDNISGTTARVELRLYDLDLLGLDSRVVLGGQVQYDDVRGTQGTGLVTLRIPFGPGGPGDRPLTPIERRMVNPIVRDIDVVSNPGFGNPEAAEFLDGTPIGAVTVVDANTVDVAATVAGAGPGSIVVFDGSQGDIDVNAQGGGTVVLADGQFAGGEFMVVGATSGTRTWFGDRPTVLDPTVGFNVFTLADNSTVTGMDILGGRNGIYGNDVNGFTISNNVTAFATGLGSGPDGSGVRLNGTVSGDLINNLSTGNSLAGFDIDEFTSGTILDNILSGNDQFGLSVFDFVGGTVADNEANDNGSVGMFFININGGTVSGNEANENVDVGIIAVDFNGGTVADNVANENGNIGFIVNTLDGGTLTGNVTNDNGDDGLNIFQLTSGVVEWNEASGNLDDGIDVGTLDGGTFRDNFAFGNADDGIDISRLNGGLVSWNTAIGNGEEGFQFGAVSGGTVADNFAAYNVDDGFDFSEVAGNPVFIGNHSVENGDDGFDFLFLAGGSLIDNLAAGNAENGFEITHLFGTSDVSDNESIDNAFSGFDVGSGFLGFSNGSFDNNLAEDNGGPGYFMQNVMGGATATGNTGSGNASDNTFSFP